MIVNSERRGTRQCESRRDGDVELRSGVGFVNSSGLWALAMSVIATKGTKGKADDKEASRKIKDLAEILLDLIRQEEGINKQVRKVVDSL